MNTEKIATVSKRGEYIIGKEFASKRYAMEKLETGEILLTPVKVIPENHETFFTKEAREQMEAFNKYIATETSVTDSEKILDSIRRERDCNAKEENKG